MNTLSIIIPVYNVESYLYKCLDSILVDNLFTGQVICVNDGSTDRSLDILEKYAAKYPNLEVISQTNAGLSAARNTGLKNASGDYVFFIDSDDWIIAGSIVRIMSQINGEDVIYFNARIFYEDTENYKKDIEIKTLRNMNGATYFEEIYDQPRNMSYVCVCGGIYSRLFLLENDLYNEPGIYHEDNYFTPQVLLLANNVSSVNEYVYVYRIRGGSITANVKDKHIKDMLFIARNLYAKYKIHNGVSAVFYQDICNIYMNLINSAYNNSIPIGNLWSIADSKRMLYCSYNSRTRKVAILTFLSPKIAFKYMQDKLSNVARRLINIFL